MSTTCPVCTTDAGPIYFQKPTAWTPPTDETCEQLCSKINTMMIMKQDHHFYAPHHEPIPVDFAHVDHDGFQ